MASLNVSTQGSGGDPGYTMPIRYSLPWPSAASGTRRLRATTTASPITRMRTSLGMAGGESSGQNPLAGIEAPVVPEPPDHSCLVCAAAITSAHAMGLNDPGAATIDFDYHCRPVGIALKRGDRGHEACRRIAVDADDRVARL